MTRNIIAVVVLVALAAVAFLVFSEGPDEEKEEVARAIEPVPVDSLDAIEIIRHEGSGDTLQEELIVLERGGSEWRMVEPVEYAVNPTSVQRMVDALGGIKVIDVISENEEKHHVLEVDDDLGIEVKARAGDRDLAHLIVGLSRGNVTFVRLPGEKRVFRIRGSHRTTFNKSAKNLRDKAVLDLDKGSVSRISFSGGRGDLTLERKGEGEEAVFAPVGVEIANFDEKKARNIARGLESMSTRDFADEDPGEEATGLDEGADRVEYEATDDGEPVKVGLWIGKDIEKERQTYLKTSLSDQIFLVSTHLIKRMRAAAEDFERTDEQVAEEAERERKRREAAAKRAAGGAGGPLPAMSGAPSSGEIPPEVMEKLRRQMEKNQASAGAGR